MRTLLVSTLLTMSRLPEIFILRTEEESGCDFTCSELIETLPSTDSADLHLVFTLEGVHSRVFPRTSLSAFCVREGSGWRRHTGEMEFPRELGPQRLLSSHAVLSAGGIALPTRPCFKAHSL